MESEHDLTEGTPDTLNIGSHHHTRGPGELKRGRSSSHGVDDSPYRRLRPAHPLELWSPRSSLKYIHQYLSGLDQTEITVTIQGDRVGRLGVCVGRVESVQSVVQTKDKDANTEKEELLVGWPLLTI